MAEQKSKVKSQKSKVAAVQAPKAVAKTKAVKSGAKSASKAQKTASANLTVSVYGLDGKSAGKISLPAEVFGQKVNKKLLAQAIRVYQANKRQGNASTKTRGEVDGSSRKIYRQKGTGRARHGTLRAPIFVKGGIVHGPKPRDFSLDFPKKMRRAALFSALSSKLADEGLRVIGGFEKIEPKTRNFVAVMNKSSLMSGKRRILIVAPDSFESLKRGLRNVEGVRSVSVQRLNALDVLKSRHIVIAKEAITEMEKVFIAKK